MCGVLSALIAVPPGLLILLLLANHRSYPISRNIFVNTTDKFKGRASLETVTYNQKPDEDQMEQYLEFIEEETEEVGPWR